MSRVVERCMRALWVGRQPRQISALDAAVTSQARKGDGRPLHCPIIEKGNRRIRLEDAEVPTTKAEAAVARWSYVEMK